MIRDQKSAASNSKGVALRQFSLTCKRHFFITELENLKVAVAILTEGVCPSNLVARYLPNCVCVFRTSWPWSANWLRKGRCSMGSLRLASVHDLKSRVALVRSASMCEQLSPIATPPPSKSFICKSGIQMPVSHHASI